MIKGILFQFNYIQIIKNKHNFTIFLKKVVGIIDYQQLN